MCWLTLMNQTCANTGNMILWYICYGCECNCVQLGSSHFNTNCRNKIFLQFTGDIFRFDFSRIDLVRCCYNAVQYNMSFHTTLKWLKLNINLHLNSQMATHSLTSPVKYGVSIVSILEKIDCIGHNSTAECFDTNCNNCTYQIMIKLVLVPVMVWCHCQTASHSLP